ncbi:DNA-binding NarL/FixJ family response regulator [Sphingopyxis sp. OAS728]|uniref:response regulator transcription factor n=1 Tax=Sphingopyxis sp. OAS728 TaxID=2663823 RepID=UPI00178C05E4|nr:LuxR C-terminal-related transcriptional regulator [Sphingopyxis sp. OAS728]MBE1526403.1 DNA-binding NarL/FixJ family response regulator [Sphingopyxis sp. OAS728]
MEDSLKRAQPLTERELSILELLALGQSTKEISRLVDIAPRTVERMVDNIRSRFDARNRAHLITVALRLGLLSIEGK